MNNIRKIDTLLGEIALWGAEGFDDKVHENFTKLKAICEELNYTIADINSLLATIQAVNALGGIGLANLANGDILEWDSNTSKFKNTNLHSKTEKTTLADADEIAVASSADGFSLKKISWATIKTLLLSLFITKVTTPITGALVKINSLGNLVNSNIINKDNGNVLIGTTVDNGVDLLQVNGSIKSTYAPKFNQLASISGAANNLNTITTGGIYYITNDVLNIPFTEGFYLEVIPMDANKSWVMQRATSLGVSGSLPNTGRTFVRCFINNTAWSPWVEK